MVTERVQSPAKRLVRNAFEIGIRAGRDLRYIIGARGGDFVAKGLQSRQAVTAGASQAHECVARGETPLVNGSRVREETLVKVAVEVLSRGLPEAEAPFGTQNSPDLIERELGFREVVKDLRHEDKVGRPVL
jgi:hypothetical protein